MDLINQMTDDSMVDTEKNMSLEIPEGEDRYAYSYRRYNKRAACIEHEEGKLQILTNLIKDSILTIQGADKRMNMTEEVFRRKMR